MGHGQGDSVHFVQSVLFAAIHNRTLLPDSSFGKHFRCRNIDAEWHKSGHI
jgi:hypothetical protein